MPSIARALFVVSVGVGAVAACGGTTASGIENAACSANCPVTDDASFQLYLACIQQAATNGCQSYSQATTACEAAESDGGAAACLQGSDFQSYYNALAPIFCSSGG